MSPPVRPWAQLEPKRTLPIRNMAACLGYMLTCAHAGRSVHLLQVRRKAEALSASCNPLHEFRSPSVSYTHARGCRVPRGEPCRPRPQHPDFTE